MPSQRAIVVWCVPASARCGALRTTGRASRTGFAIRSHGATPISSPTGLPPTAHTVSGVWRMAIVARRSMTCSRTSAPTALRRQAVASCRAITPRMHPERARLSRPGTGRCPHLHTPRHGWWRQRIERPCARWRQPFSARYAWRARTTQRRASSRVWPKRMRRPWCFDDNGGPGGARQARQRRRRRRVSAARASLLHCCRFIIS